MKRLVSFSTAFSMPDMIGRVSSVARRGTIKNKGLPGLLQPLSLLRFLTPQYFQPVRVSGSIQLLHISYTVIPGENLSMPVFPPHTFP